MSEELFAQLVQVKKNLKELIEIIDWECCPKTARKFKRQVNALTKIVKQLKAEKRKLELEEL